MKTLSFALVLLLLGGNVRAREPNRKDLQAAIDAGDFAGYYSSISTWLNEKVPADSSGISAAAVTALLGDPVFANTLDQRQLISKLGVANLGAFAKTDAKNKEFLAWLLPNTAALDLYLEAAVPTGLNAREANNYGLGTGSLEIWKTIFFADPDSREGLCLRLAIATGLAPPGSGNRGAGMTHTPGTPLARYLHFKTAHKNKELFPSFDDLTVWEYTKVVSSCASDADLAWAREMINTWRPDLRIKEQVVNSTSEVWRRNSPHPYTDYKAVLSGGGKCGPRSSWSVMICQAFGIPAIGVGQPAHACVAYKVADPSVEPQPGSAWKVGYGRGWQWSHLEGMSGREFMAGVEQRSQAAQFAQVEHLRWLAATLVSKEQAAAVMAVAHKIQQSVPVVKTDHHRVGEGGRSRPGTCARPQGRQRHRQCAARSVHLVARRHAHRSDGVFRHVRRLHSELLYGRQTGEFPEEREAELGPVRDRRARSGRVCLAGQGGNAQFRPNPGGQLRKRNAGNHRGPQHDRPVGHDPGRGHQAGKGPADVADFRPLPARSRGAVVGIESEVDKQTDPCASHVIS